MKKLFVASCVIMVVLALAITTITVRMRNAVQTTEYSAVVLEEKAEYYILRIEKGPIKEGFLPVRSVSIPLEKGNRIKVVVIEKRLSDGQYDIGWRFKGLL